MPNIPEACPDVNVISKYLDITIPGIDDEIDRRWRRFTNAGEGLGGVARSVSCIVQEIDCVFAFVQKKIESCRVMQAAYDVAKQKRDEGIDALRRDNWERLYQADAVWDAEKDLRDGFKVVELLAPHEVLRTGKGEDVCVWIPSDAVFRDEYVEFPVEALPTRPFAPRLLAEDKRMPSADDLLLGYYWKLAVVHDRVMPEAKPIIPVLKDGDELPPSMMSDMTYDFHDWVLGRFEGWRRHDIQTAVDAVRVDLLRVARGAEAADAAKETPPATADVAALVMRLLHGLPDGETVRLRTRNRLLGFLEDGANPQTNGDWATLLGVSSGTVSNAMKDAPETRKLLLGRKARRAALTGKILDSATARGDAVPDTAAAGADDILKRLLETCKNAQDREALQKMPRAELNELIKQFGMQAADDGSGYVLIETSNQ